MASGAWAWRVRWPACCGLLSSHLVMACTNCFVSEWPALDLTDDRMLVLHLREQRVTDDRNIHTPAPHKPFTPANQIQKPSCRLLGAKRALHASCHVAGGDPARLLTMQI
eukprot:1148842-Pelagomonas_calceolata.AAC.1